MEDNYDYSITAYHSMHYDQVKISMDIKKMKTLKLKW